MTTEGRTGTKVDDKVEHENCVWEAVEDDPMNAEVVVEEGNGDWKNDEVCYQQQQHHEVPVEPVNSDSLAKLATITRFLCVASPSRFDFSFY